MGHPAEVAVRGRSKLRAHSAVEVLGRGLALTALITKRRGCASEDRAGSLDRRLAILLAGMAAVASMMAEPALGIFINDKFDPNAPPVLAASNEFPNVLLVGSGNQFGSQGCTGTLISPTQVLTAAHCFFIPAGKPNAGRFIGTQVDVASPENSATIPASAVIINPGFDPKRSSPSSDIALVVLSSPINNLTPVNLQTTGSPLPPGTPVYIVGYGQSGRANGSDPAEDGQRRIAQSLIGNYLPLNQLQPFQTSSTQTVYAGQFRDPANPNQYNFFGLTAAMPPPVLQGGTGPGDSGGPLFICPKGNLSKCAFNELVEIGTLIGGANPQRVAVRSNSVTATSPPGHRSSYSGVGSTATVFRPSLPHSPETSIGATRMPGPTACSRPALTSRG